MTSEIAIAEVSVEKTTTFKKKKRQGVDNMFVGYSTCLCFVVVFVIF